jgi:hypothetical protein
MENNTEDAVELKKYIIRHILRICKHKASIPVVYDTIPAVAALK